MSSTANITLRQLRVFLAVAELRNFSPVSYTHLTLPTTPYV